MKNEKKINQSTKLYNFLEYKQVFLHYEKKFQGKEIILAFHGFNQSSQVFKDFKQLHNRTYTLFAINLFYHGDSKWNRPENKLSLSFWKEIMEQFFKKHDICKFSIIAYSIGSRLALSLLKLYPERIEKVILIAPDGVFENRWYKLAVSWAFSRFLFRQILVNYHNLLLFLNLLKFFYPFPKNLYQRITKELSDPDFRHRLYHSWLLYRAHKIAPGPLRAILKNNQIRLDIYLAEKDPFIPSRRIGQYFKKYQKEGELQLFDLKESHHRLLRKVLFRLSEPDSSR